MSVFLIQTNGRSIHETAQLEYIYGAKGATFVDEPLRHQQYYNTAPYWTREGYGRRATWETATAGDIALLYCSSLVDDPSTCLSHVLPIIDKNIDDDGAVLKFDSPVEIAPKIGDQEIQRLVRHNEFSEIYHSVDSKGSMAAAVQTSLQS